MSPDTLDLFNQKTEQLEISTNFQQLLENAFKFCETFDNAINKWSDQFSTTDNSFQLRELEAFVQIAQEELEEKENLLIIYKTKLNQEISKKTCDFESLKTIFQLSISENELLRNKLMATEKFMLNEKMNYKREFDRVLKLLDGIQDGKTSVFLETVFNLREEVKKCNVLLSKCSKRKNGDHEIIFKLLEKIGNEFYSVRKSLDQNYTFKLIEEGKSAFIQLADYNKIIKNKFETVDFRNELKDLQVELVNVKKEIEKINDEHKIAENDVFVDFFFDFNKMYKNIEESIRKLVRECKSKQNLIQDLTKNLSGKSKSQNDFYFQNFAIFSDNFTKIKSKVQKITQKLNAVFEKPLFDFYQLKNEVKFAIETHEEAIEKTSILTETFRKLYGENVLRTKIIEGSVSEIDLKMMIRKLNEIKNEFFND